MSRGDRRATCLVAVLAGLSCGKAPERSTDSPTVRTDSGGVEMVHNRLAAEGDRRLPLREVLRIGALDGPEHLNFSKIADVVVGPDGTIYVANGTTVTVRAFDSQGKFLGEFARSGDGPGEFAMVERLWIAADSIVVADWNAGGKVAAFSRAGRVLASRNLTTGTGRVVQPVAFTPRGWVGRLETRPEELPNGEIRMPQPLYRLGANGEPEERPTFEAIPVTRYRSKTGESAESPLYPPQPDFGFDAQGRFYQAHSLPYRIEVRRADGTLQRVITKEHSAVPMPDDVTKRVVDFIDRFLDTTTARIPKGDRGGLYERIRTRGSLPKPPTLPPTGKLLVGPDGELWVNRIDVGEPERLVLESFYGKLAGAAAAKRWDLFDSAGAYTGYLELPERFWPMALGRNRAVGVLLDDLDVEYLVAFEVGPAALTASSQPTRQSPALIHRR